MNEPDLMEEPDLMAVTAHSLLNSVSVIVGAAELLEQRWEVLDEDARTAHLKMIGSQGRLVAGVLQNLVRGLPAEVIELLDSLSAPRR